MGSLGPLEGPFSRVAFVPVIPTTRTSFSLKESRAQLSCGLWSQKDYMKPRKQGYSSRWGLKLTEKAIYWLSSLESCQEVHRSQLLLWGPRSPSHS